METETLSRFIDGKLEKTFFNIFLLLTLEISLNAHRTYKDHIYEFLKQYLKNRPKSIRTSSPYII